MNKAPLKTAFILLSAFSQFVGDAMAATIAIDVGHSLKAQGSTSAAGHGEFVYNRALARDLARQLIAQGHKVELINEDGAVGSLAARPARAKALGADLLVSIHHDSIQPQLMPWRNQYRGYSVWASGSHPAAQKSLACGRIISTTLRNAGMTPALFHAQKIKGEGHNLLDARIGLYRRDNLAVLRLSQTPAVLIEAGVIVNPVEEAWLNRAEVRNAIAHNIAIGISNCTK